MLVGLARRMSRGGAILVLVGPFAAMGCARSELLGEIGPVDAQSLDGPAESSEEAGVVDVGAGDSATDDASKPTVLVVAIDGSGQFVSVSDAVASISDGNRLAIEIDIRPGIYREKLTISNKNNIALVGEDPLTTVITFADDATSAGGTMKSASVSIVADDFSATNIGFTNSTTVDGAQAVAVFLKGARIQFFNCRFVSFQDTIYAQSGTQYFRNCLIEGDDDYILGGATALFHDCEVFQNVDAGVAVTAPNTDMSVPYGFVFLGGMLTADSSVKPGAVALGRPWGAYGSTLFIDTFLGSHISPVGWVPMNNNDLTFARFAEYRTTGPGADVSMRAPASRQLTDAEGAAITIPVVLGGWVPSFSR